MTDGDDRVPAGWYPDPLGLPQLRWWDNHAWTEHTSDARQPVVSQPQTPLYAPTMYAEPDDAFNRAVSDIDETTTPRSALLLDAVDARVPVTPGVRFADPQLSLEAPLADDLAGAVPSSRVYDLGVRFDDLLDDPTLFADLTGFDLPGVDEFPLEDADPLLPPLYTAPTTAPDATAFPPLADDDGPAPMPTARAASFIPDPEPERSRFVADVEPTIATGPAWVLALSPVYVLIAGLLLLLSGVVLPSPVTIFTIVGVPYVVGLVLAVVDARILRAQGIEEPPSPLWAAGGPLVYLVARLQRTIRLTGNGFGPLLTLATLGVFAIAANLVVPGLLIQMNAPAFVQEAEQSVRSDASILGAKLQVHCPAAPPMLVGQSFTCAATNAGGKSYPVTVSLQRANGWISWRVDDWGVYQAGS